MSVENPELAQSNDIEPSKAVNGDIKLNGVSNGHSISSSDKHKSSSHHHHKSSSKDKNRDKDRERDKDKDRNRDKDKDKSSKSKSSSSSSHRDKERSSSGKSRHSSSHKSSRSDKDKDHDKDKDKTKTEDKEKEKSSSGHGDKDRERNRDKDKSSSGKDRHSSSHKSSRSDKDREKDKTTSSSSAGKDKNSTTDKSKERHKSSSSKDKHSSSSSSKSRHHSSSSSSKDKHRDKSRSERKEREKEKRETETVKDTQINADDIKTEVDSFDPNTFLTREPEIKIERCDGDIKSPIKKENSFMNASQASSCDYSMSQFKPDESAFEIKPEAPELDDEDEDVDVDQSQEEEKDESLNETANDSVEDITVSKRKLSDSESEDDMPLTARKKVKKEEKKAKKKKHISDDEDDEDFDEEEEEKPKKKKAKKEKKSKTKTAPSKIKHEIKASPQTSPVKGGRKVKKEKEEEAEVWKWWEEEKKSDGNKWNFLEHKGPVFAPEYIPLPDNVKFSYNGKEMKLSQDCEEVACFYAKMLEHDYTTKQIFNDNFFKDWRKTMSSKEKETIKHLDKCNFKHMHSYFTEQSEKNKSRTKEQKLAIKEENEALLKEYGFCTIDGHKEKIGNFRIEPPGLFRGRGEHPKMGMVKRRVMPNDILINCSKDSKIPHAPNGSRWREVRHDNTVTWLASWTENVQGQVKYVMLNPSSKLKGEKDWQKYETARRLHKTIDKIRGTYREEWKSKEMRIRQRAVALYFIDKLALRAGNEKDEDQADTVGCCSLRVEHITLHNKMDGKENVVEFDFLGKDSIRYYNAVDVEKRVFKNLELFKDNKKDGDDLFDRLNTSVLNEHLRELMDGLTAKVFRTYNASITLQRQLEELTEPDSSIPEKLLSYNRANRAVAILCNHQRAVPKGHGKSMENLKEKITQKRQAVEDCEAEVDDLQRFAKRGSVKERVKFDQKKKQLERLKDQLKKLELQETDRDENKTIALGTSKLNYLDPRISVAWCKKFDVPIEKIFNKTQRDKFRWAIDMADETYSFANIKM